MAEARRAGADDGLFLNTRGAVASTTMANIFAVIDGEIATPAIEDGVLAGTIRALLLDRGAIAGLPVRARTIEPATLRGASEVFMTNSVRLVCPVTALDGTQLAAGPVARVALAAVVASIATECGDALDRLGA
ncbi:aminotransferase class IV [Rhizobiales bacterium Sp-1]|uniref:branched-chain-amino-acid transaminase n=2 Tax=Segnochrobactrum spirostomi TaxID=2608987 RepID=A0A6A7XZH0_9HYPH|nr:aminotransferase class IV [Segnochrobactrum spirostomi]